MSGVGTRRKHAIFGIACVAQNGWRKSTMLDSPLAVTKTFGPTMSFFFHENRFLAQSTRSLKCYILHQKTN